MYQLMLVLEFEGEEKVKKNNRLAVFSHSGCDSSSCLTADEDASTPSSRSSSMRLNPSDTSNYFAEDRESDGVYHHLMG